MSRKSRTNINCSGWRRRSTVPLPKSTGKSIKMALYLTLTVSS